MSDSRIASPLPRVLSMINRTSYGLMTSPGWREGVIVFEGNMTFMGVSMRLRQSIHKKSNDETLAVNEEWLEGAGFRWTILLRYGWAGTPA